MPSVKAVEKEAERSGWWEEASREDLWGYDEKVRSAKNGGEKEFRKTGKNHSYPFHLYGDVYQQGYYEIGLRKVPDLDYSIKELRRNWTGNSEQSSGGDIGSGGGEPVIPLYLFSLEVVGIYYWLFPCQSTELI